MNKKNFIQLVIAFGFSIPSFFFSLYEGSHLILDSFDWVHTTKFTHFINANPNLPSDISNVDFFIYAVKFRPFFPIVFLITFLYGLFLLLLILQKKYEFVNKISMLLGLILMIVSVFLFSTLTIGTTLFSSISLFYSLCFLLLPLITKKFN